MRKLILVAISLSFVALAVFYAAYLLRGAGVSSTEAITDAQTTKASEPSDNSATPQEKAHDKQATGSNESIAPQGRKPNNEAATSKVTDGSKQPPALITTDDGMASLRSSQLEIHVPVESDPKRGFFADLLVGHVLGFEKTDRSFTQLIGEAHYRINHNHEVSIGQEAKKLYLIAPSGESEFLAGDTLVSYEGTVSDDFLSTKVKLNLSTTVPVSDYSRLVKHVTRPMLTVEVSRSLLNDRIQLSYKPAVAYYFNEYGTDPSGVPLHKMAFAQAVEGRVQLWRDRLSLVLWGQSLIHFSEQYDYAPLSPAPKFSSRFGSFLDCKISKNLAALAGYTRGNSLVSDLRYEDNFYDSQTARYYAALRLKF